jgi:hypothetical protein
MRLIVGDPDGESAAETRCRDILARQKPHASRSTTRRLEDIPFPVENRPLAAHGRDFLQGCLRWATSDRLSADQLHKHPLIAAEVAVRGGGGAPALKSIVGG